MGGSKYRVEVWIEKDALKGIFERVCDSLQVPLFSCRGYTSQSEMWVAAQRMKRYTRNGQKPMILHFGDHDPSGLDMTRDILDRLQMFMGGVIVSRLALNYDQIEQYAPPENPAKLDDPRATSYVDQFGYSSWELDALDPRTLSALVRSEVENYLDVDAWEEAKRVEQSAKNLLLDTSRYWDAVTNFLEEHTGSSYYE